jgi:hypothetical protein
MILEKNMSLFYITKGRNTTIELAKSIGISVISDYFCI